MARPHRGAGGEESASEDKAVADFVRATPTPLGFSQLTKQFSVTQDERIGFKRLLKRLASEGKIRKLKGRRYAAPEAEVAGAIPKVEKSGNKIADKNADASVKASKNEGLRARIVREGAFFFALVGTGKERTKFVIPKSFRGSAKSGETVLIKPLDRNGSFGYPVAKVLSGVKHEVGFSEVAQAFFKELHLPHSYPKAALLEAEASPEPVWEAHKKRLDLRSTYIVTIDPADAKDHDDAISLEKLPNGNWKLGVHIADVSEYVPLDSPLDEEALRRAYTQYLPWTAAPMLPQRLSGDLCSLLEGKERLAFSCMMDVNAKGELLKYEFVETFIQVSRFHSYEEAQALKEQGDPFLNLMSEFTDALLNRRREDGYLEFQFPEPKVKLDADRTPIDIYVVEHLPSHGWIEECMLLANQATAKHLEKLKIPGLFRVHEQPDMEVVKELWGSSIAKAKGHDVRIAFDSLKETQSYLNPAIQNFYVRLLDPKHGALPPSVQRSILRSMKKAQYDARSLGHFALGWLHYAHFTSPIRRYADLWTHRVMKMHLHGKKIPKLLRTRAIAVGTEISDRELIVQKVERKAMKIATAWIFQKWIGKEFIGDVSGVENFGVFVSLTNPYGEGLIPVARMRDDFYEIDPKSGHLVGHRFGRHFELGQKVKIRLARSDPFSGQVDFDFLGNP